MTFKSSNRLGEKRVQFLNSGQNSSIFEALWLLIWILLFTKIKKIMSWAEKCFHLLLELPNKPFKWSTMPIPWLEINCWKSENAKMTQNGLSSPKCIFWLQPFRSCAAFCRESPTSVGDKILSLASSEQVFQLGKNSFSARICFRVLKCKCKLEVEECP